MLPVGGSLPVLPRPADADERQNGDHEGACRGRSGGSDLTAREEVVAHEETRDDDTDGAHDEEHCQPAEDAQSVHIAVCERGIQKDKGITLVTRDMTTVVVLADPPVEACVPALLPSAADAGDDTALYRAMLADVCTAIQRGEGEVLINHPPADEVPPGVDPVESIRDALADAVPAPDEVRYEVQVGETEAGTVGNALTHLLESEQQDTVAFADPTAVFLRREHLGNAAMQLRSHEVVLGPAPGGRVYFAGFREPIDFEDCFASPAIETLAAKGREADSSVSFLPMTPLFESSDDYETAISLLRARRRAERLVPEHTAALVEEWGLSVGSSGDGSDNS